jgi:hypothetical protein
LTHHDGVKEKIRATEAPPHSLSHEELLKLHGTDPDMD